LKVAVALRRRARFAHAVVAVLGFAARADAYEPILHEFIPEDPREDVALAVTTVHGDLPAALQTRSGLVKAPDTQRPPAPSEKAYGESAVGAGPGSTFRIDRDTHMPDLVRYDDPFSPSLAPYKRLRAFDQVGADYGLRVRDGALSAIPIGGEIASGEDVFYGDVIVDFPSDTPVRIPAVGPGARVLRMHVTPAFSVELYRDGADNWSARFPGHRGRARLVLEIAIARAVFGGEPALPPWDGMPAVVPLPPRVARAAKDVASAIGVSRADAPGDALRKMVAYFRSFAPSDDFPHDSGDIYRDLALSKKGVCRHRAFAFLVTALGLGLPTRMVTNEAHAWVEVQGEKVFHRIDLGGTARAIEESEADSATAYQSPADAFPWPANAEPVASARVQRQGDTGAPGSVGTNAPPQRRAPTAAGLTETNAAAAVSRAPQSAHVVLGEADSEVHRGGALRVAGSVDLDGLGCPQLRVDVALVRGQVKIHVGTLATDTNGAFSGAIVVPMSFEVGDYQILASTPGDATCGEGSTVR
jgi:hypothetical protein